MPAAQIRALTFDVFGTAVDWRNSIARETEAILSKAGLKVDGQQVALAWRSFYQPSMEDVRSGRRAFTTLDRLHRESLLLVLHQIGINDLGDDIIDHLNRAWHRLDPWPDVVAGLHRLKKRFVLATLSNGNVALTVNMAKHAGLPWDLILGAEIAQAYKPDPRVYQNAMMLLNLRPEECLMVAAHNDDLVAAAATGMNTAFIVRSAEYGPGQTKDLKAEHPFDCVAEDFLDLADQLGV